MESEMFDVTALAEKVRKGARYLAREGSAAKDDALQKMADALRANEARILSANAQDVAESTRDTAFVDRLKLTPARIEAMAAAVEEVKTLPDPVGRLDEMWRRPNGLKVGRQRMPLGVIGIIYEARPNVTSDAAALCLKSGNGVLLRGGSDAFRSNRAIAAAMREGLEASSLAPEAWDAIGFIDSPSREAVNEMLTLEDHIDVIIPRGGKGLIRFVSQHSRIPVIKHDEGVCHVVVEGSARSEMVDAVLVNAKVQRPTVCNAAETVLFTRNAVEPHLLRAMKTLVDAGVYLFLCDESLAIVQKAGFDPTTFERAEIDHYHEEFLDLRIAVRVVEDVEAAVEHIAEYGSRHTEALLTEEYALGQWFLDAVDSSCVVLNASTRFADGGQLGLGAEIGISTTRLHAYGPMGIEELTTTKFVVLGSGQIRG